MFENPWPVSRLAWILSVSSNSLLFWLIVWILSVSLSNFIKKRCVYPGKNRNLRPNKFIFFDFEQPNSWDPCGKVWIIFIIKKLARANWKFWNFFSLNLWIIFIIPSNKYFLKISSKVLKFNYFFYRISYEIQ